jgi:CheY-like chemotaxis protein
MSTENSSSFNIVFYVFPRKYKVSQLRHFYRDMASDMASGLNINLYSASSLAELKRLVENGDITHVFMGEEEYDESQSYLEELAEKGINVAVSADAGFKPIAGSRAIILSKPLYGCSVMKVLNGEAVPVIEAGSETSRKPVLDGVRALVVDDEPMNLVVATGLFREYNMIIDTARSGMESLARFAKNDYDIIFMDHMMPEMDGIEAMKRLREAAVQKGRNVCIVALTANAVSGAREMFLREGFDGFISKPINISDFDRTINKLLPMIRTDRRGGSL